MGALSGWFKKKSLNLGWRSWSSFWVQQNRTQAYISHNAISFNHTLQSAYSTNCEYIQIKFVEIENYKYKNKCEEILLCSVSSPALLTVHLISASSSTHQTHSFCLGSLHYNDAVICSCINKTALNVFIRIMREHGRHIAEGELSSSPQSCCPQWTWVS